MFNQLFPRRVVDAPSFGDTAVAIGRAMREGQLVDIDGMPMFFRDLPNPEAQRRMTGKANRLFTPEEIAQVQAAAAVNRQINDALLIGSQRLYDDHDSRRMAGMALTGLAAGGLLGYVLAPPKQVPANGDSAGPINAR